MKTGGLTLSAGNFWREAGDGIRDVTPLLIAVLPFGGVFGALAAEQGLSFFEIMLASATIFAGASQYAMIDLMGQNVPAWSIVLAVFAINFRHVLYSASLGRFWGNFSPLQKGLGFFLLVDLSFASAESRAMKRQLTPAYYFTYGVVLYGFWMVSNYLGALFGKLIAHPEAFGFDFVLPLYFVAMLAGFHRRPNFAPVLIISVVTSLAAFFTIGSPWHISIGGVMGLLLAAILSKPTAVLANE